MSPTAAESVGICRGVVEESTPGRVVLAIPRSDYRLHLVPTRALEAKVGDRVCGRVHVRARRIDRTGRGGAFIDPVIGRPATIQGRVVRVGDEDQTIVVESAVGVWVKVAPPQQASDFKVGDFVCFAVEPGAGFSEV